MAMKRILFAIAVCVAAVAYVAAASYILTISGLGPRLGGFIAYSPQVPLLRKWLIGCGCAVTSAAVVLGIWSKLSKRRVMAVSDVDTLSYFSWAMFLVPISCFLLTGTTKCDFLPFQSAASLLLFLSGSIVAVRTRRYKRILYYLILMLVFGGLSPAT